MARRYKNELGEIAGGLYRRIYELTPRQRRAVLRMLDGLTSTNCGWTLYEMREVLRGFVSAASHSRSKIRKQPRPPPAAPTKRESGR